MFERPRSGERAILVHTRLASDDDPGGPAELQELAGSAGAEVLELVCATRDRPEPKRFVGRGKAEEIRARVEALGAELVIFGHPLSPAQERNLEAELQCRVIDRIGLILDIFAQRASSFEGKLQVELAQLRHLASRLVRGWTHLERQKGGIGLRGPGETQLETDRRLIWHRIRQIESRLEGVRRQRGLSRRARRRAEVPVVSLVGYTNAGKSTLFNRLSGAGVLVADRLFATLDPTLRRLPMASGRELILADTVGFIRRLPHELVAAFRATLEETLSARLLLHVIDAGDPERIEKKRQVAEVLAEIGADSIPQIEVYNKCDRVLGEGGSPPPPERDEAGRTIRVWVSATTGAGLDALLAALAEHLDVGLVERTVFLPPGEGRLRARLFALGEVLAERPDPSGGATLEVRLPTSVLERLCRHEGLEEWLVAESPAAGEGVAVS